MTDGPTLIERALPQYDARIVRHRLVPGTPEAVYAMVREIDFLRAWRENGAVRVLFAVRGAAERLASAAMRKEHVEPEEPESLRLTEMPSRGDWVRLGEDPPREIAFGVIGRFWGGETVWDEIDAADFPALEPPARAKIACNLYLRPHGERETLVTYEARTRGTDAASTKAFKRYWRAVSPGVGLVMGSLLKVLEKDARQGGAPGRARDAQPPG